MVTPAWAAPPLKIQIPSAVRSVPGLTQVVRASLFESRPLGDGAPLRPGRHRWPIRRAGGGPRVGAPLGTTGRRVLPRLLASIDREVHQRVAVVHGLYTADGGPVGLEDTVVVAEVT